MNYGFGSITTTFEVYISASGTKQDILNEEKFCRTLKVQNTVNISLSLVL